MKIRSIFSIAIALVLLTFIIKIINIDSVEQTSEKNNKLVQVDVESESVDNANLQNIQAQNWYKQSCSLCHGNNFTGNFNNPAIIDVGDKLTVNDVYNIIVDGKGDMPGGFLQGVEARKVAEWLVTGVSE